jgi:hypothetical protein
MRSLSATLRPRVLERLQRGVEPQWWRAQIQVDRRADPRRQGDRRLRQIVFLLAYFI